MEHDWYLILTTPTDLLLLGMVAKKVRILGDPSKSLPPVDATPWAAHTTSESKFIFFSICMNLQTVFKGSCPSLYKAISHCSFLATHVLLYVYTCMCYFIWPHLLQCVISLHASLLFSSVFCCVFFELFIKERWAFRKVTHLSIFILMTSIPNHLHSICKDVILTNKDGNVIFRIWQQLS